MGWATEGGNGLGQLLGECEKGSRSESERVLSNLRPLLGTDNVSFQRKVVKDPSKLGAWQDKGEKDRGQRK